MAETAQSGEEEEESGGGEAGRTNFKVDKRESPPLRMTPLDKKFLRSLKITVEEDDE